MKILIVSYPIQNIGGIVNHTIQLAEGFVDLGHEVQLASLHYKEKFGHQNHDPRSKEEGWEYSESLKLFYSQKSGFAFHRPGVDKFCYKGQDNINRWKEFASQFDVLIWTIPVPTKQKDNQGNHDWLQLYDLPESVKQIGVIHDGNLCRSYPWLYEIRNHLTGLACVHPAAWNSSERFQIYHSLIVNPQDLSKMSLGRPYEKRAKSILSLGTFKSLKHFEDYVRAIPHLPPEISQRCFIAGGGLAYSYMTSPDKTKPEFYATKKIDPDLADGIEEKHVRSWDLAVEHGMKFLNYIDEEKRDKILDSIRVLLDSSWNMRYAGFGGHFNRVIIDAAKRGTVPVAINYGISENEKGISDILMPDRNYIMLEYNLTPKEYAEKLVYALNLPNDLAESIRENNFELCAKFDRKMIAQRFIDLSLHVENDSTSVVDPNHYVNTAGYGYDDPEVAKSSRQAMTLFFGA